jgi:2-dehydro-3-deoxyphosphooctonate aldolase (KDO 8-P synthase)
MPRRATIAGITVGESCPLALIAGPCVLESEAMAIEVAESLEWVCRALRVPLIFKASFDKANRTHGESFRGPGVDEGLRILARVRSGIRIPVLTDVHDPRQAEQAAEHVDVLQIPAFLCRQTDLITACARTGRPLNIKKGQFVAPRDMAYAVEKAFAAGATDVVLTERGTTFGYHDLVVDFRSIRQMAEIGVPVCFDATHSVQQPGTAGGKTGGNRTYIPDLSRAAVAAGADLVFAEVHPDPGRALSDASTQWPLAEVPEWLASLCTIAGAVGRGRHDAPLPQS